MTIKTIERFEHDQFLFINRSRFILIIKFNGLYIFSDGLRYIYSNSNSIQPGLKILNFRNTEKFFRNSSGLVLFDNLEHLSDAINWVSGSKYKRSIYNITNILLYLKEYVREYPIIFKSLKMMKVYILNIRKLKFFY